MTLAAGTPVFLLGAGASRDANLPLVRDLTFRIYQEFRQGGPAVVDILDFIRRVAPAAYDNYEALFEWIYCSNRVHRAWRSSSCMDRSRGAKHHRGTAALVS